jgi:hypothetical protein
MSGLTLLFVPIYTPFKYLIKNKLSIRNGGQGRNPRAFGWVAASVGGLQLDPRLELAAKSLKRAEAEALKSETT